MITVSYDDDPCHLAPGSFFKLSYGVRPSFGCFTMSASDAEAAVSAGTSATLRLHNIYLYNIYPIKSEVGDALNPTIGRIYFADERIVWPFFYGSQDYNTYRQSTILSKDLAGGELDYDLDNLNPHGAIVDLIDGGGGSDQVKIAGNYTAVMTSGRILELRGSSDSKNNGSYTISSSSYGDPNTTINIPTGSLTDATATGGTAGVMWTFTEIFEDIFETILGLAGANYTLHLQAFNGAAPTRNPRNIRGKNIPIPEILHQVLAQANCFLAVDLLTNPPHYQVMPIGDEDTWQSGITYRIGETTLLAGVRYRSLQSSNTNKDPSSETAWWIALVACEYRNILISAKTSRSDDAKMLTSRPFFENDGFYGARGAAASIGGTGDFYAPSPYEAFYVDGTIKNSSFLSGMGDELAAEYKLSFQNNWHDIRFSGAIPLSLGRGAQEIIWELSEQKGFTTRIRSFRPREEAFPIRHTLFARDRYWKDDVKTGYSFGFHGGGTPLAAPTDTLTTIPIDFTFSDPDGWQDSVGFVVPHDGIYHVSAAFYVVYGTDTDVVAYVVGRVSGGAVHLKSVPEVTLSIAALPFAMLFHISGMAKLNKDDLFIFQFWHEAGGANTMEMSNAGGAHAGLWLIQSL